MKRSILPALALLALVATNEAHAQVPRVINYQGVLTDLNGKPVIDGNRTVVVKLYDAAVGGNILFSETQTVRFARGVFNVTVGAVTPIPMSLTFDHPYYLGVSVESNPELTPRTAFASAPYSVRSASAAVADSLSSNAKVVTGINGQIGALNVVGSGTVTVTSAGGTMTIANNGVASVNGATGDVQIQGTGGTTVTRSGNTLMISSANGSGGGIKGINNLDESIVVLNPTSANPQIGVAEQGVTTNKIADGAVTDIKIASVSYSKLTGIPAALPPTGTAGGDLTGNYPNPTIADGAITDSKISNGGISYGKIVGAPTSLPPNGTAGGDLAGNYPNPTVAANAITTSKIADGSVTDAKVANGISYGKLSGAPTSLPPSGTAGGDLAGNYPNPTVAANAISTTKIADGAITTSKVVDGAITDSKIANGVSYSKLTGAPTSLPPSGTAGGDLSGSYPNPTVADNAITDSKIANGISYSKLTGAPTSLPPSGTAGGDLAGNYPNPTVADNAISSTKLADGSVTDAKVANGISYSKLSGAPTSLPPSGTAGGDLVGSYPNPTVADNAISSTKIADGAVSTSKVADNAITDAKIAEGISYSKLSGAPTSLPPSGTAGGDLTGNYPNPTVADNAITDAKIANGISYSKLSGAPTSLPPSGTAGGDLTGNYPNPTVADNAISSTKLADGSVMNSKLADSAVTDAKIASGISYSKLTGAPTSLPPSGTAGGDLVGSYPNPTVADNAISTTKIADGSVTDSKIAEGISYSKLSGAPTSLPPSGTAGGDLTGNYPNPTVADNAISSTKITDAAISTSKVADGAITDAKIAEGISYSKLSGAPTSLPPSGTAGGDLTGSYPNPMVADNAISSTKLADGSVMNSKLADSSVTDSKIADGISYSKLSGAPTSLPPSGTAGGDLTGSYPNPTVADNAITDSKIASGISYSKLTGVPTSLPPSGTASGDLAGNYPNPTVADNAISSTKIADGSVMNSKLADSSVTDSKIADGISYSKLSGAPTSLPPSGTAGGDLTGNYPNPMVADNAISSTKIADGAITDVKIAEGISYSKLSGAPTSLPPSGTAGGDLTGSYPNPTVADNAISSTKIADGAITDSKIAEGISYSKLSGAPTSFPPSGTAGGDLTGSYPNPTVADNAISSTKLADGSVMNSKLADSSVTDSKIAEGISYSKLSGAPTSLPPSGTAGGDLTGSYPNPTVADNAISSTKITDAAISTSKVADGAITDSKLAEGISYSKLSGAPTSLPPSGTAGGDLTGNYPNPTVADNAISSTKLADGSVTDAKIAEGISYSKLSGAPTSLPPSGTAGGDLTGNYPNPTVADNAISSTKLADGSVMSSKLADSSVTSMKLAANAVETTHIVDGSVTDAKLADGISYSKLSGAPTSLPPGGTAGGDLTGNYPNPTVADNAISSTKLADGSVTDSKIAEGISYSKLSGAPTSLPPSGTAGGDLTGNYPDPTIADNAVTDSKIANGISYSKLSGAPTSLPPSGTAGGDLTGNYPDPTIADNAISSTKLADASVTGVKLADGSVSTMKVIDSAVTSSKLATGSVATAHIADAAVTTAKIDPTGANAGQALVYNGSNVAWGDVGLALPYSGSVGDEGTAFSVTNTSVGRTATFNISNGANGNNALEASTDGTGYAASFTGSGASSNGVYIQGGVGQTGLELNRGRMVLSYDDGTTAPAGNGGTVSIPDGSVVVVIRAGATTGGFNVNLPNGVVNGQTLTVFNSDANTATVTSGNVLNASTAINSNAAVEFIWVTTNGGSGWIGK